MTTLDRQPQIRAFDGFEASSVTLISPPDAPVNGAMVGPPGFTATAHRLVDQELSLHSLTDHTVVLVVEGRLDIGGEVLGSRDSVLMRPGEAGAVRGTGTAVCLAYRERDPNGVWATAGRRRRGVARHRRQKPLRRRFPLKFARRILPVLSPLDLYPVVGPTRFGPGRFAVRGPQQLMVVQATTPPGTGPALHIHQQSVEMFIVLQGSYRLFWGEHGEHEAHLDALGAAVFPTGTNRAFEATGEGDDWILPVVVGANDERDDIRWLPPVADALRAAGPPWLAELVLRSGRVRIRR